MVDLLIAGAISLVCSTVAAMGLGGGGVLILALSLMGISQGEAAGINLISFIPTAAVATLKNVKDGSIKPSEIISPALFGIGGALLGVALSGVIGNLWLTRIFSLLLIAAGLWSLFQPTDIDKR